MPFIFIPVGLAVLLAGRKIFWLAVAAIGFIAGMKLAALFVDTPTELTHMLIALGLGVLCALAAIAIQKIAVGLAGFLAGGYGAFICMKRVGLDLGNLSWIPVVVLGLVGVIIAAFVFEWALIIFSSAVGAYLVVSKLPLSYPFDG